MEATLRFKRKHNRTAEDIYRNTIRPRLPMALDIAAQKIVFHARRNHNYENRSGALENSISWVPAKRIGNKVRSIVMAGGEAKALFKYVIDTVFYYDEQGRLRVFKPKNPKVINKGQEVNVDYAVFVERKGLNVLKHSVEKFRHLIAKVMGVNLKHKKSKRPYKYKYTGEMRDLYGR